VLYTDNETEEGTPGGKYDTETEIACPESKDITVTQISAGVTKCTVHIAPQKLGTGILLTNVGTPPGEKETITGDIEFKNVKYTQTEGTGAGKCATTTTTSNGSWIGKLAITGKNPAKEPTSIWLGVKVKEVLPNP
jgi:hypothetical protein